jgi:hypothetical protein
VHNAPFIDWCGAQPHPFSVQLGESTDMLEAVALGLSHPVLLVLLVPLATTLELLEE